MSVIAFHWWKQNSWGSGKKNATTSKELEYPCSSTATILELQPPRMGLMIKAQENSSQFGFRFLLYHRIGYVFGQLFKFSS